MVYCVYYYININNEIKTVKKFLVSLVFGISVLSFGQINGNADENGFKIDETNQSILLFVYKYLLLHLNNKNIFLLFNDINLKIVYCEPFQNDFYVIQTRYDKR